MDQNTLFKQLDSLYQLLNLPPYYSQYTCKFWFHLLKTYIKTNDNKLEISVGYENIFSIFSNINNPKLIYEKYLFYSEDYKRSLIIYEWEFELGKKVFLTQYYLDCEYPHEMFLLNICTLSELQEIIHSKNFIPRITL
jgi:hypothetical protein